MYEVAAVRVPEFAGCKTAGTRIPAGYAVQKADYIKDKKETIAKMDEEIAKLEKILQSSANKESYFYKSAVKRLAVCQRIKKDCEESIYLTKVQMKCESRTVRCY